MQNMIYSMMMNKWYEFDKELILSLLAFMITNANINNIKIFFISLK